MSLESGIGIRPRTGNTEDEGKGALELWKGVTSLSDKERDEIEFQVKIMIKRCLGRMKELEKGEEGEEQCRMVFENKKKDRRLMHV